MKTEQYREPELISITSEEVFEPAVESSEVACENKIGYTALCGSCPLVRLLGECPKLIRDNTLPDTEAPLVQNEPLFQEALLFDLSVSPHETELVDILGQDELSDFQQETSRASTVSETTNTLPSLVVVDGVEPIVEKTIEEDVPIPRPYRELLLDDSVEVVLAASINPRRTTPPRSRKEAIVPIKIHKDQEPERNSQNRRDSLVAAPITVAKADPRTPNTAPVVAKYQPIQDAQAKQPIRQVRTMESQPEFAKHPKAVDRPLGCAVDDVVEVEKSFVTIRQEPAVVSVHDRGHSIERAHAIPVKAPRENELPIVINDGSVRIEDETRPVQYESKATLTDAAISLHTTPTTENRQPTLLEEDEPVVDGDDKISEAYEYDSSSETSRQLIGPERELIVQDPRLSDMQNEPAPDEATPPLTPERLFPNLHSYGAFPLHYARSLLGVFALLTLVLVDN